MKDLETLTKIAIDVINECCNYPDFTIIERPLSINYRAKSRWGQCKTYNYGLNSQIEISSMILADDIDDEKTLSVIIHELLHAVKGAAKDGHKGIWKKYANMINKTYPEYQITRCASTDFFGIDEKLFINDKKYAIQCTTCGNTCYSSRLSKSIKHPDWYRCTACGNGHFIRIK